MVNTDYRDAIIQLNKLGLNHEESFVKSEDVTEGYVISMIPDAGAEMKAGDTVFLEISTGPEIKFATMPQLVGDTISTAQAKLEGSNLVMGTITERPDDAPAGTVTWQSRSAGESVQEKTKINVIISSGPAETPPPPEENEEVPPEQQEGEGQPPEQQGEEPAVQEGDGSVG
jgi:serine/threonine-protein kinase